MSGLNKVSGPSIYGTTPSTSKSSNPIKKQDFMNSAFTKGPTADQYSEQRLKRPVEENPYRASFY